MKLLFTFGLILSPTNFILAQSLPPPNSEAASSGEKSKDKIEAKKDAVYSEFTPDIPAKIYSKPCPFDCNSEGFSHSVCIEWKQEDECFIGPKD